MGKLIRGITRDGSARIIAIDAPDIVNRAIEIHSTTPTASAALGRVLLCSSMMGSMLGEPEDMLTLRFNGDGPGGSIVVSSDYMGNVRGFIQNPTAELPHRPDGKLNVGGLVGRGNLFVLRDNDGQQYTGVSPIVSGEIAEDIAKYYADSEQVPTVCALGVLIEGGQRCKAAGGILIQLLPFADDEICTKLEENVVRATSVTDMLCSGGLNELLSVFLDGIEYDLFDEIEPSYVCLCSREKTDRALIALDKEAKAELLADEQVEMTCQFCDKTYIYSKEELKKLYEQS